MGLSEGASMVSLELAVKCRREICFFFKLERETEPFAVWDRESAERTNEGRFWKLNRVVGMDTNGCRCVLRNSL